jgi:hypothetical protein
VEVDPDGGRCEPLDDLVEVGGSHEVGLGQHDHRHGAAVPDQADVALDAAGRDPPVGRHQHQHGVDVGGEGLGPSLGTGRAADDGRPAGQGPHDDSVANEDPVADGDGHPGRDSGPRQAGHAEHGAGTEVEPGDPAGFNPTVQLDGGGQRRRPGVVPAEIGEIERRIRK